MLLEERRSVFKHVLLNVITLGLYGVFAAGDIARDTEVACWGDGEHTRFGGKEAVLSVLTLGLYYIFWMLGVIRRWNRACTKDRLFVYVSPARYVVYRLLIVTAPLAVRDCFQALDKLCEVFNEEFFKIDENDPLSAEIKKVVAENLLRSDVDVETVAGYRVIEEWDPTKDRRRIDRSAEIAAAEREEALRADEEKRRMLEEMLANEAAAEAERKRLEDEALLRAKNAHRSPKWFYGVFAALFAIFILPITVVCVISFALPAVYDETFVGVLADKYERLETVNAPKIVVVGGSSVPFGLDSEMIEEELGMKVVDFGLYANLGTKLMMDLSKVNINKGDIVILAPELNSQTLSLYFNAETALQAMDGNWRMLNNVDSDDYEALIGALWQFSAEKLKYLCSGERPTNSGAYEKRWFNEYGDNTYERKYNITSSTAKTISLDFRVRPDDSITSEYEQFISYVNDYTAWCEKQGATVYFSFAPMNEMAMTASCTEDNIYSFYKNLCKYLDCKVISNINDYIMDEGYFFDSEFHLNDSGVTVRTVHLIDDIKRERGDTSVTVSAKELPGPSGFAPIISSGDAEENLYLQLELVVNKNGDIMWSVIGLNDAGKTQTVLRIPDNVVDPNDGNSYPVVILSKGAFSDSSVETIYLGENIGSIEAGAFSGAKKLTGVYVPLSKHPGDISVPNDMDAELAVGEGNDDLKIYVNGEYYVEYVGNYFWGDYKSYLQGYTK